MILFLKPYFELKPWAGDELNKIYECPNGTGEAWIVSGYNRKSSIITNGIYKGRSLRWLYLNHPELFGYPEEKEFPLLLKIISAGDDLSVQVHPNDDYALKTKNQLGKFECWYFLDENKATDAILGVNVKNAMELKTVLEQGTLENYLIRKPITNGDLAVINPGRVHALTKGSFILEAQESSDITYRLYDYNRLPKRELHIKDSLNVIDYDNDRKIIYPFKDKAAYKDSHFDIIKLEIGKHLTYTPDTYLICYVLDGNGILNGKYEVKKGDPFIVTKDEKATLDGNAKVIAIVPKKKGKERLKMRKVALITGVISQDGYYLSDLLLSKDYEVHGLIQTRSQMYSPIIKELEARGNFFIHCADMTDTSSLNRVFELVNPDEIYHLAKQSHVDLSFEMPEYTTEVNAIGTLRLLDAIRNSEIRTKLFNMSSPYLFSGDRYPQTDETRFEPKSPFAVAEEYAYRIVNTYRECYNIYAVNGICYNHESKYRNDTYVSQKIINAVKRVKNGEDFILELGNLNASREWGHAKDYAKAMWLALQLKEPTDFIISTGKAYTVRDFVIKAYKKANIDLVFEGRGLNEVGIDVNTGKVLVKINKDYLRPNDAKVLVSSSTKFKDETGFEFEHDIDSLIDSMMGE